jgi:GNAT superfamily N-acetyltransferase
MELYFTVREGETPAAIAQPPEAFRLGFLTAEDVEDLIRLEPETDRKQLIDGFSKGKLCYGVWDKSRLIAKMWCDLDNLYHPPDYRRLDADEVYLYAAFVDPDYQGQGLAPLMRASSYSSLREMGRSKFYSYTDFFNTAARHFKVKLGAREEALRLHLGLFGKWSKTFTLRRYG